MSTHNIGFDIQFLIFCLLKLRYSRLCGSLAFNSLSLERGLYSYDNLALGMGDSGIG